MKRKLRSLILAVALSAGLAPAFAQAPPPVPALPDTERRTSYVISASTCACNVNFQLYGDSTDVANWLKVYINGVEVPQSGNWNITSPSGSISTLPRPITDAVLTFTTARTGTVQIVGAQRPRRLSEYAENRGVAARDLNQAINAIEAQLREMWDRQFRTVQAPPGETLSLLAPLASRASMGACFDSGGNLTSCVSVPSSTFAAGNGITFTGVNPTTIAANLSAVSPIVISGTNPIQFSCPTCGGVTGTGTPTAGDLAIFPTAATTPISSPGYNVTQVPGLLPTTSTVLISNGSPGIITWAAHGLTAMTPVFFCNSGGALPTGLTACLPVAGAVSPNTYSQNPTLYYVCSGAQLLTNSFAVATTVANAKTGTCVNTSSAGSGTHTAFANAMACAGCVGEFIYKRVGTTTTGLTTGTDFNWGNISVPQGIWVVGGSAEVFGQIGATTFTHMHASINYGIGTSISSAPYNGTTAAHITSNNSNGWIFTHNPEQVFFTTTTQLNGTMQVDFTGGTAGGNGTIWARRIK